MKSVAHVKGNTKYILDYTMYHHEYIKQSS